MTRKPQDTSAEEPDGGNLHVRFRGGPGRGNRPGLLNRTLASSALLTQKLCFRAPASPPVLYGAKSRPLL
jgi:hypothetical protein